MLIFIYFYGNMLKSVYIVAICSSYKVQIINNYILTHLFWERVFLLEEFYFQSRMFRN